MGDRITGISKGDSVNETDNRNKGDNSLNPDSSSSGTAETGTSTGTATEPKADGGTQTSGEEKAVILGVADVVVTDEQRADTPQKPGESDEAYEKRLLTNAKRRQRYRQATGQAGKPAKVNKAVAKATNVTPINTMQLEVLLKATSEILASRPGMEVWKLTDPEIKSLSAPINNMIAKSDKLGVINEHADALALCVAVFTIIVPRLMITMSVRKEKKINARTGNITNTSVKSKPDEKAKVVPINDSHAGQSSTNDTDNGSILSFCGSPTA